MLDSARKAHFDRSAYTDWLKALREVCTERGIALIFDEVFVGFRIAPGGAQEYFGVRADMVTYGKTVAGGLPVGVLCGRHELMRRFRDDRPADICFARGTFNSHPYVMGAMHEFLTRLDSDPVRAVYRGLDERWNGRAQRLNERLAAASLPVRVANLSTIWTLYYPQPSGYNWMLQYYLRAAGLALSWVGTGRLIFSLNYSEADFSRRRRPDRVGGGGNAARRLVVGRSATDQQSHQTPRAQGNASGAMGFRFNFAHRIDQFAPHQIKRRLGVNDGVVERIGQNLGGPYQAGLHALDEK